jgi:two-component system, sensor histidine kinase and response regulator
LDDESYIRQMRQQGVVSFLRKPVTQSDLLSAIRVALGQQGQGGATGAAAPELDRELHVLLAEDNPTNQQVVVAMLESRGDSVVVVADGAAAVERTATESFDLVLMDVQMPRMGGFEATDAIRQREQEAGGHMLIVGLTANAMRGDRDQCLAAGMDDYVAKPMRQRDLAAVLNRLGLASAMPSEEVAAEVTAPGAGATTDHDGRAEGATDLALGSATPGPDLSGDEVDAGPPVFEQSALRELEALDARGSLSLAELIDEYASTGRKNVAAMRSAIAGTQAADLRREAHTLKGSARFAGTHRLASLCQALEDLAKQETFDGAEALLGQIEAAFVEATRALRTYLDRRGRG